MSLLSVSGLNKSFRGLKAVSDVSFDVEEGTIQGVIGANGAGKTTMFNLVAGMLRPDSGTVHLDGKDITGSPPHRVARAGMSRTFQLMRPFASMSVVENVAIAAMAAGTPRRDADRAAADVVERVGLGRWRDSTSADLPTAGLKRLELARALAGRPRVLLLDEVLAGLVPAERTPVMDLLEDLRREDGVTLVFVEHIMAAVMRLSDTVIVMDQGQVLTSGTPQEVTSDPRVIEAYLERSRPVLVLDGLCAGYSGLQILHELEMTVGEGEIVALVGANGAGKTTTLRAVSGVIRPTAGSIVFAGERADGRRTVELVARGLVHVPEERALFGPLTVQENLRMGAWVHKRSPSSSTLSEVLDLFPILAERSRQTAETLSGGQQQMLCIGRALMARPRLLMLDEPSTGLSPKLTWAVLDAIRTIRDSGVAVLLVEQNAGQALALADRAYVLESGSCVLSGTGAELAADDRVRAAYLGL